MWIGVGLSVIQDQILSVQAVNLRFMGCIKTRCAPCGVQGSGRNIQSPPHTEPSVSALTTLVNFYGWLHSVTSPGQLYWKRSLDRSRVICLRRIDIDHPFPGIGIFYI